MAASCSDHCYGLRGVWTALMVAFGTLGTGLMDHMWRLASAVLLGVSVYLASMGLRNLRHLGR